MIVVDPVLFPPQYRPMPAGYRVVQLDSGHYVGIGPVGPRGREVETGINVDRYAVRRWTFEHAEETRRASEMPGVTP